MFNSLIPKKHQSVLEGFEKVQIDGLSKINLFIGRNNSGKSRFMRKLSSSIMYQEYDCVFKSPVGDEIKKVFELIMGIICTDMGIVEIVDKCTLSFKHPEMPEENIPVLEYYKIWIKETNSYEDIKVMKDFIVLISECIKGNTHGNRGLVGLNIDGHVRGINNEIRTIEEEMFSIQKLVYEPPVCNKIYYIPILRGLRPVAEKNTNHFLERTIKDYNDDFELTHSDNIFTGLELYSTLTSKLLGKPDDRKLIYDFEKFLSREFFGGLEISLIPHIDSDVVEIKIGSEEQLAIYNLGDGIQQLIILLFPIFVNSKPCLFFIEEPELYMHPGMQRSFIETIANHTNHQYFFTTHSNHLLDMTSDYECISVFKFEKTDTSGKIVHSITKSSGKDFNLLNSLGIRASSVFHVNATIWVEGITDRLYLREYMKKFLMENRGSEFSVLSKYKEDYHYSFIEYQGSNLIHWNFSENKQDEKMNASNICSKAFVIADNDVSNKGNRVEVYSEMLGDRFLLLNCKEIENLLPEKILKGIVKEKFEKNNKLDGFEDINFEKYSSLKTKGIGKYLDEKIGAQLFSEESGTVKNKVKFCEDAISLMKTSEWDLPDPMKEICQKIFEHIKKFNS